MAKGPRYQVFISSTYRDLKDERAAVQDAVLRLGHFPIGMELFPATHGTPWELIQAVIDDSDYYVLVIGGRYGSTTDDGIGFTEREYDYALATSKRILVFLHDAPGSIPRENTDTEPALWQKLLDFRAKVQAKHHCNTWATAEQLQIKVLTSLMEEIRRHPMNGWIPNDGVDRDDLLLRLTALQSRYDVATAELAQVKKPDIIGEVEIEGLNKELNFAIKSDGKTGWINVTLAEILIDLAPLIITPTQRNSVYSAVQKIVIARKSRALDENGMRLPPGFYSEQVASEANVTYSMSDIAVDLVALDLIAIEGADVPTWQLTKNGARIMLKLPKSK